MGFHITPVHYYSPIPDTQELRKMPKLFERRKPMMGVDLNDKGQINFLESVIGVYSREVNYYESVRPEDQQQIFSCHNASFKNKDAEALYSMVRYAKPKNVIEIGGGGTTILLAMALRKNGKEGYKTNFICIEPYPVEVYRGHPYLTEQIDGLSKIIKKKIQEVEIKLFSQLGQNDILFIDSSHVAKIGSDVCYEILEILPSLNKDVLIHFHDIFFPKEYPKHWILEKGNFFWNEMYLLHAFLLFNDSFKILWSSSYMHHTYPDLLKKHLPIFEENDPGGSIWIRKYR